ncbi:MAG: hypothetical protein PHX09_00520 [Clostridia bacterium]|nr:hypothetical protein [Clostridia bacterium]MDD4686143.1 hypothetical protein [Clostridia bacterium]
MNLKTIINSLKNIITVKQLNNNEFQLTTLANYPNKQPIVIYLQKVNNEWILVDKKEILKFMNNIYDLSSAEVKGCINNVIKVYNFKMQGGVLIADSINETNLAQKVLYFTMCIAQLINMYPFFESPE